MFCWLMMIVSVVATGLAHPSDSKSLGDLCNYIEGCHNQVLVCVNSACICASGYRQQSGSQEEKRECHRFECTSDSQCQQGDPYRLCDHRTGRCDRCQPGLVLDHYHPNHHSQSPRNRCLQPIGSLCTKSRDCNRFPFSNATNRTTVSLICRFDRCVCPPDSYPSSDWSVCLASRCSHDDQCDAFHDDPNRVCQQGACVCKPNYREQSITRVCLPQVNVIMFNYLLIPLLLALLMLSSLILVIYSGKRIMARIRDDERSNDERRDSVFTSGLYRWYMMARRNSVSMGNKIFDRSSIYPFETPPPAYSETVVPNINAPGTSRQAMAATVA